jgi:hypothetical protein
MGGTGPIEAICARQQPTRVGRAAVRHAADRLAMRNGLRVSLDKYKAARTIWSVPLFRYFYNC